VPHSIDIRKRRLEGPLRPTVLIVDREALYRWFVSESLNPQGVHAVQCRTLAEAAAYISRHRGIDLVIADAQTVTDEGDDAMAMLSVMARSTPFLLLDSSADDTLGVRVGSATIVEKPVDSSVVARLVDDEIHRDPRTA
jgi:DNA-binding response OmpR family regulator